MDERQARTDEDRARSHRNEGRTDDAPEGKAGERRNPSGSNMDRPIEAQDVTGDAQRKDKED